LRIYNRIKPTKQSLLTRIRDLTSIGNDRIRKDVLSKYEVEKLLLHIEGLMDTNKKLNGKIKNS